MPKHSERALEQIERLKSKNEAVQIEAIAELVEIGKPAVEPLLDAMEARAFHVRKCTAEALGRIGDARAVESLIIALSDKSKNVQS